MLHSFNLPASGGYVVALSGGADSRLLLELTVRAVLARGDTVADCLCAAHLNHGIRGAEADRDEAFCRAECERLGVPLTVERVDVPALARASGQSEETAAREARYAFLVRTMKEVGFPALLTAHNADDQLETVLHRLLRGSGTRGMAGIPATRPLGDTLPDGTPLVVYRPLLAWSRQDILDAVAEMGLAYVTDSTNLADDCTRNRLRHQVTPALEAIAGAGVPQAAAVRLGHAAAEDEDALAAMAAKAYRAARTEAGLSCADTAAEMPAIAKRMIRMAYTAALGGREMPDRTLSAYHLDALYDLCRGGMDGEVSDSLPGHLRAEIHQGFLTFAPCFPADTTARPQTPRPLGMGRTVWCEHPLILVDIESTDAPPAAESGKDVFASAVFPADALPWPLYARGREPGDTILSHGMTKKLKKLICDKHISQELRDRLPLVCLSDGTPLWYPGVAFRDGFPAPLAGRALRITVRIVP